MAKKRYAVLIGNGKFKESDLPSLRCPERDVSDLAKLLESQIHGPYQVCPLIDESAGKVLDTIFEVLVHKAERDDVVLVYYSGHGKLDLKGHLYWTTADTRTNWLPRTSIPAQTVVAYMDQSRSLSKILIVDCCYSGAIASALTQRGNAMQNPKHRDFTGAADNAGTLIPKRPVL
jgi:hypothetical protein